jgi:hypothetical protein
MMVGVNETKAVDSPTEPPGPAPDAGMGIVKANLIATAVFAFLAVPLALADTKGLSIVVVIISLVMFAAGISAFIASFVRAAERSRTEEVGVANLYLLTAKVAPRRIKRIMNAALLVQIVTALGVASAGLSSTAWSEDHKNPMAFAALVPMLGFGLNGVWAARHGTFGPRVVDRPRHADGSKV